MSSAKVLSAHRAEFALLHVELPGRPQECAGVLLLDSETGEVYLRLRKDWAAVAAEEDAEVLQALEEDLRLKARSFGGAALLAWLEDTVSNTIRISERRALQVGSFEGRLDRLFREYVPVTVQPFSTHLPLWEVAAAAGGLGEEGRNEPSEWVLAPEGIRLTEDMFVVPVHGHSMEPLIPDGSLCVFRRNPGGSRSGRLLLIQARGIDEASAQLTVKRYRSEKRVQSDDTWEHETITLEPLNPAYQAWQLRPDEFDVLGEFVCLLSPPDPHVGEDWPGEPGNRSGHTRSGGGS